MKFYRFVVRTWNVTVGQGKFRSEAQVRRVAQQLTSSLGDQVEFEEISELAPNLPVFPSNSLKSFNIFIFILGASLLGLLLGIILFQVFMPNQANQAMERLFPSQVLPKSSGIGINEF
ncbi:MAG: hypothetical protein KME25_28615 [Symplocastrum torsivum CPER-KK1]|uniref:Uncharacterized protein n=1 Tax=Symplocastrum torsivum CPER-KK1 TaxID=450513 RepID=A0A951UCU2_9CYAN|nr:hypothetical protein [Symplocastrum torsivum CPER-KK1]